MSGSICRVSTWQDGYEHQFLATSPIGDEAILYQTNYEDPGPDSSRIVKLASRSGLENISCSGYSSVNRGVVGMGSLNGTVSIFDITSPSSSMLTLSSKQRRPCNSISFHHSRNLIAAGFDKGRQDSSLQVWDIEHYSRTASNNHINRPLSTYFLNEAILSTMFYPHEEHGLLCGSYKFLREIDLRQELPTFHLATKYTLGLTMDPFQPHLFLSYSDDGSVGVWDRRRLVSSVETGIRAKGVSSGVSSDTPVLQFQKLLADPSARKSQKPCVRYSQTRRGEFSAVLNGDLVRRWSTGVVPARSHPVPKPSSDQTVLDPVVQSLKLQASQLYKQNEDNLFVHSVLDAKTDFERVISFDYVPDASSNTSTSLVCMRQSGLIFLMPVVECLESMCFNSYNEFTVSGPEGTMTKFNYDQGPTAKTMQSQLRGKSRDFYLNDVEGNARSGQGDPFVSGSNAADHTVHGRNYSEVDSMVDDESLAPNYAQAQSNKRYEDQGYEEKFIHIDSFMGASNVLANDVCSTICKRAQLGYSVDCDANISLLEDIDSLDNHLNLRNTWRWLGLARKSLEKGTMIADGLDMGYQGVLGIWKGAEELNDQKRSTSKSSKKERGPITDERFLNAVKTILESKGAKTANISIPSDSERKAQRKLCLIVSGWYLTDVEFEEKLSFLVKKGQIEKAAGWAVFHGDVDKAIEILASAKNERFRLMSTAIAGYSAYKSSTTNSPWKDQCRKMASDLDNPYLRAIFAFIADNDWWDVLDERSLPLRERLGVALRFLSDKDLDVYLKRIKDTVVSKGELEGLILTGITPKGIDLLQSFVDRTSDVQTAALVSAFACPRYFSDDRVKSWIDSYRDLLNSWGMFNVRAKFDVVRTKLSKTTSGQVTLKAAPKQVYLQCIRCNKNISNPKTASLGTNGGNTQVMMKQFNKLSGQSKNLRLTAEDLTACPHCGAPLPRCSICLLTLGAPLPQQSLEPEKSLDMATRIENRFKEWFSFCLSCGHGCHAHHAEEWFSKHYVCPVPDCDCRCNSK